MTVVQYDFEFGNNNIPYMCNVIGSASTPIQGMANFVNPPGTPCDDISYADMITQLSNTTYSPANNMRQWTYQTCSEFG